MRGALIVTSAILCGVSFPRSSDGRAELAGCPAPQVVATALRVMNLPHADWRTLTPAKIRSSLQQLLNQVECPDRPSGIYVLASFGRIVSDQSLCSTSFTIGFDKTANREWLDKVTIFHTATAFRDAHDAGDLFSSLWYPDAAVETEEYGQADWRRTLTRPARARTVSRWPTVMAGCQTTLQIEREIYPSGSDWTVKVSLTPDSVCQASR
jgi:hypothetical protein